MALCHSSRFCRSSWLIAAIGCVCWDEAGTAAGWPADGAFDWAEAVPDARPAMTMTPKIFVLRSVARLEKDFITTLPLLGSSYFELEEVTALLGFTAFPVESDAGIKYVASSKLRRGLLSWPTAAPGLNSAVS